MQRRFYPRCRIIGVSLDDIDRDGFRTIARGALGQFGSRGEVSVPLLQAPPPVRLYQPGSWGPKSIHQLVAPHAWRLSFERAWRGPAPAPITA